MFYPFPDWAIFDWAIWDVHCTPLHDFVLRIEIVECDTFWKLNSFRVVLLILFSSKQGKQKGKYLAFRSTEEKVEVGGEGTMGYQGGGSNIECIPDKSLIRVK